jgi:hypothetical protein
VSVVDGAVVRDVVAEGLGWPTTLPSADDLQPLGWLADVSRETKGDE